MNFKPSIFCALLLGVAASFALAQSARWTLAPDFVLQKVATKSEAAFVA